MALGTWKIREHPLIQRINGFLASPKFILLTVVAAALANFFGWELPVYTLFVLVAVYCAVLGRDLLPWIPMVVCGYLAPSVDSNPGKNAESIFNAGHGGEYVMGLAVVLALAILFYICREPKQFFRKRTLLWGLLGLSLVYFLGGLNSPANPKFTESNRVFAALQAGSLLAPYLVISGGVKNPRDHGAYFCQTGFGVGCLVVLEILWIYLGGHVTQGGRIDRDLIYTGWGMYNNMGGLLATMIPFAFYMAYQKGRGWLGMLLGSVFLAAVFMTNSRSSIIAGVLAYGVGMVVVLRRFHGKTERLILGSMIGMVLCAVLIFHKEMAKLFDDILNRGGSLNHRDEIWAEGWKQFKKYPIFGGGFFPLEYDVYDFSTVREFSKFFPPRWHNTIVQLAASTGVVGLAAYAFHRLQTVIAVIKNRSREVLCIGMYMLVLIITCIFDCHFFNIGPVLFYAMGLAFIENTCNFGKKMI